MGWKVQEEFRGAGRMKRQVYILVNGSLAQHSPNTHKHTLKWHLEHGLQGFWEHSQGFDLDSWNNLITLTLKVHYNIPSGCLAHKYWLWQLGQTKQTLRWGCGVLYRSLVQNKTPSCKAVTVKPWVMLNTHTHANSHHNCPPTYQSYGIWSIHPSFLFQETGSII